MAVSERASGYREIFENTRDRLLSRGVAVALKFGPGLSPSEFESFQDVLGIPIPSSLRQFYLEVGNGLNFRWPHPIDRPSQEFCRLSVPTLEQLLSAVNYLRMLNECLADHDFADAKDSKASRGQYHRQLTFFPVLTVNADLLCIEPAGGREAIVFCDHEWSFSSTGNSGVVVAESLKDFWQGWAQVGFVEPPWWPSVIVGGQVNWTRANFGFRLD